MRINERKLSSVRIRSSCLIFLSLGCCVAQAAGYWVSEGIRAGKEGALCTTLQKRLNQLANDKNPHCMDYAIESYPGFKEPPWEDLDPRDSFNLIVKLMRYSQEGARAYFDGPVKNPDSLYRDRAEEFITRLQGRVQVWRTSMLSDFETNGTAAPREQTIVMLTMKWGDPVASEGCPAAASHGLGRSTFLVLPDLSGPDPSVSSGTSGSFSARWPVLYDGKAIMINSYSVNWPVVSCVYKFLETSPQKAKEK